MVLRKEATMTNTPDKHMQPNTTPELDKLYQDVLAYRSSEAFKGMMNFIKNFPHIAPYNAMLLHMQFPGCQLALTAEDWRRHFKRFVNLGARPLIIMRTFGPISFVFDISDTEGDPVPDSVLHPFRTKGAVTKQMMNALTHNMLGEGIRFSEGDQAAFSGGFIAYGGIPEKVVEIQDRGRKVNIWTVFEIVVNKNNELPVQFATLLHELGHFYCGHCPNKRAKWLPKREYLDGFQMEFEAETVSWLVCERLGIENHSEEYLAHYLEHEDQIPVISIDAVIKAVGRIELLIHSSISPRKELLIKEGYVK